MSLQTIFGRFVGREIPMTETPPSPQPDWDKGDYQKHVPPVPANIPDPVILDMTKTAQDNGLALRVMFGGPRPQESYELNRVTATVDRGADNVWRVSSFDIG